MESGIPSNQPPQRTAHRPGTPMAVAVLIAVNMLVFLAWQVGRGNASLLQTMVDNFMVSTLHLRAGHVWTLLTAAFSHFDWWHLLFNMVVVWSFGGPLARILGVRVFVRVDG